MSNPEEPNVRLITAPFFDSGPVASFEFNNQFISPYTSQPRDPEWGIDLGGTAKFFRREFGGDRTLDEYSAFFQVSYRVAQDWILWSRLSYQKLRVSSRLIVIHT